ncbi:MAG: hypothetical protein JNL11_17185 [Bdellovibrionaceae bacterium]|nr:hypothetical protein [Pseudobdellovibrionaceae bacterium]
MKNLLLAVFLTSYLWFFNFEFASAQSDCTQSQAWLNTKNISIEKQITSLLSLLEKSGTPQVPIELIFQVDIVDQEQVNRRLSEIRKLTSTENVLKTTELKKQSHCFLESPLKSAFISYLKRVADLNLLKVKFFELPKETRVVLVKDYNSQRISSGERTTARKEVEKVEADLAEAQKKLNENFEDSLNSSANSPYDETVIVAKSTLQQYLVDYASEHLEFLKAVEEKTISLNKIKMEISSLIQQEQNEKIDIKLLLPLVNSTWVQTVDFISDLFKGLDVSTLVEFPQMVDITSSVPNESSKENYSNYFKAYADAKKGRLEQTQKRTQIVNDLRAHAFQILSEVGQLRSRLFYKCDKTGNCLSHRELNAKNLSDFAREIEIIPIKIRAGAVAKTLELKGKLSAGVDGWIDLFQQLIALIILLAIPLVLLKSLNWINSKLDSTRKSILSRSMMDFRKRTSIALWISRINPFVPAFGMVIGIWTARKLIETTDISELSQLLFYLQIFFIYRIFRLLVQVALEVLFSSESVSDLKEQKIKVENSAKRISRLIFLEYALLFLIETTARRALLYGLASNLVFYFNLIFIFWEAFRWNQQIFQACDQRFPGQTTFVKKLAESKILFIFSCPFLVLTIALHDIIQLTYRYLIQLDFFKKIHSEIFRRRIESDVKESVKTTPNEQYLKHFDYYLPADKSILVSRDSSVAQVASSTIELWLNDRTTEDLIIIVGNRGMGKTTVLSLISKSIGGNINVFKPSPKTTETSEFFSFLSTALGAEIRSIDSFIQFDFQLRTRMVILIDDIQNLFLGKISGFETYCIFVEILSLKTKNIFWCVSVNSRSWSYLKGALGREHLYGKVLELPPWKDSEIQELIIKRHEQTGYSRQFDKSIKAYGASAEALGQQAETQFFRLLWGQSRGNPRSALMYWISAVSQIGSEKIVVGVPSFVSSSLVASMSDDSLFLLASIARHESLTQSEMQAVTNIPNSVIRKCMKEAIDKELVWYDLSGRYRISSRAQYVIDYFLIGKNFLYE